MNIIEVLILSIVEGITEFLPVSSTGHLILTAFLLKIPPIDFFTTFEIVIQFGAILAVLAIYGKLLWEQHKIWPLLIIGFLPSALAGLILYKFIKQYFLVNPFIPVITLFIGGLILIFIEKILRSRNRELSMQNLDYKKSFYIGLFQTFSIIPGVSRSAATIVGGLILGMNRKSAAEFSFLLAIPTMLGATALDLSESNLQWNRQEIILIISGVAISFISALLGVKFLIKFVEQNSLAVFGVYRIILSILYFILFLR